MQRCYCLHGLANNFLLPVTFWARFCYLSKIVDPKQQRMNV